MLRVGLACALLPVGAALRAATVNRAEPKPDEKTQPSSQATLAHPSPLPQHAFGAEKRACRIKPTVCNKTSCRSDREASRIIGGEVLDSPNLFPFLAWIGDNDGTGLMQFCGGSLIHPRVVLTAAHCLYESSYMNSQIYVRFRTADFSKIPGVARSVTGWTRHTGFSHSELFDDLGLLLLNESVPDDIKPLKVSDGTQPFEKSGEKTLIGWGSTNEECTAYDTLLRRTKVPMGTYGPECTSGGSKTLTLSDKFDTTRQLCAGDFSGQMHYPGCGDSGGPLMAGTDGDWTQVGMVSWSYGVPYPDVFTRVSHYKGWIEENIEKLLASGK